MLFLLEILALDGNVFITSHCVAFGEDPEACYLIYFVACCQLPARSSEAGCVLLSCRLALSTEPLIQSTAEFHGKVLVLLVGIRMEVGETYNLFLCRYAATHLPICSLSYSCFCQEAIRLSNGGFQVISFSQKSPTLLKHTYIEMSSLHFSDSGQPPPRNTFNPPLHRPWFRRPQDKGGGGGGKEKERLTIGVAFMEGTVCSAVPGNLILALPS